MLQEVRWTKLVFIVFKLLHFICLKDTSGEVKQGGWVKPALNLDM